MPTPNGITIAIDGYAGCGKSTTARALAARLGYLFIDTGAMYRAVTYGLLNAGIDPDDEDAVFNGLHQLKVDFDTEQDPSQPQVRLNGQVLDAAIRTPAINAAVSQVARQGAVREFLLAQQRQLAEGGGVVMDGRDIGTVVFPNAELKIFMTASVEARVRRRMDELAAAGQTATQEWVRENIQSRDRQDETRPIAPLRQAKDARLLDTTRLSIDQQVDQAEAWARQVLAQHQQPAGQ